MSYEAEYRRSLEHPEAFWAEQAAELPWFRPPSTIFSTDKNGIGRWFADGELNTAYMALDYHVEQGRGEQAALIYDSPLAGEKQRFSYRELRDQVARGAGALRDAGVGKGDRVVIYMPMIPEAVIAMLAVARLGAVHSVVFGGFAPHELAIRIEDARPKVVISASCGFEPGRTIPYKPLLDEALELSSHQPDCCFIVQRSQASATLTSGRDHDWQAVIDAAAPADCVPVKGTDPLYILFTSGTTGKPKGVVRDNGGHAVALHYSMRAVYNLGVGDAFCAASDVGWVVGHSYIVYAPLLAGATTVLYEGKPIRTPDAGSFWRMVEEYRLKAIFAAPTAFRAIRKEDPEGDELKKYDLGSLETIFMAGERLDPATYEWAHTVSGKPVVDHWWQTETGWSICANFMGIEPRPTKPGSVTLPAPGYDIRILGDDGHELATGEQGVIAIKLPLPPGCLTTIWENHDRFRAGYLSTFPGYYVTGDGGYKDEDGYLFVMGRTDDVINVAGHRLSTGEMEEIVAAHPAVAECAVIGIHDELKGQLPMGLVVLKNGDAIDPAELERQLVESVRHEIGPIACFQRAVIVNRLPKTRSGKVLRKLLRQLVDGEAFAVPSTIEDPAVVDEIAAVLSGAQA